MPNTYKETYCPRCYKKFKRRYHMTRHYKNNVCKYKETSDKNYDEYLKIILK